MGDLDEPVAGRLTGRMAIQKEPSDPRRMLSGPPGRLSTNDSACPDFSPFSHIFVHLNLSPTVDYQKSWLSSGATQSEKRLPPRLADHHEGLIPWQRDAVREAELVEHDGRLAAARVVLEETAGWAGLEEVEEPPVEAAPGAGVAEVDRAVRGLDRRVREPDRGALDLRGEKRLSVLPNPQQALFNYSILG
jgi:hypothetical protein